MSNDTKYWTMRGAAMVMFFVSTGFLGKAVTAGFSDATSARRATFWFALFGIAAVVNVPLYFYYRKAKANRWVHTAAKTKEQLEVEVLAAYAKQQQLEQEKKNLKKPN